MRSLILILLTPVALLGQMRGTLLNRTHPLARGLSYWAINEGTGDTLFDLTGHGTTLTNYNAPTWSTTAKGPALLYNDGATEYSQADSTPVVSMPLTMNVWFTTDDLNANQCLMSICDASSDGNWWFLSFHGAAGRGIQAHTKNAAGTASGFAYTTVLPTVNKLYMATAVFESTTLRKAYINGGDEASDTTSVTVTTDVDRLSFGRVGDLSPADYLSGQIFVAMLWDRALSAAEIASLYRHSDQIVNQPRPMIAKYHGPIARRILIRK